MEEFNTIANTILVETFNNILRYEEKLLRESYGSKITINEAHLVEAISKLKDIATISNIAASLGITLPSATIGVKKLEKKGFVTKKSCDDDGRRTIVTLTKDGEELNEKHTQFHQMMVKDFSKDLSKDEQQVLLVALTHLNNFFNKKIQ